VTTDCHWHHNYKAVNLSPTTIDCLTAPVSHTPTAQNKAYAYDSLDRLITDATDGAEIDLAYDLNGNRLNRSAEDGSLQESNEYLLSSNRIALSDVVEANLPVTTPPAERLFQYNNRGRLYQVYDEGLLVASYVYNADGLRTRKITDQGITIYHYDQFGQLISETNADGSLIRDYVWQDFEPIAQIEPTATSERIVYLHTDHLNTPRLSTDSSQTVQ
jgi:YD repeat-containing protein